MNTEISPKMPKVVLMQIADSESAFYQNYYTRQQIVDSINSKRLLKSDPQAWIDKYENVR